MTHEISEVTANRMIDGSVRLGIHSQTDQHVGEDFGMSPDLARAVIRVLRAVIEQGVVHASDSGDGDLSMAPLPLGLFTPDGES